MTYVIFRRVWDDEETSRMGHLEYLTSDRGWTKERAEAREMRRNTANKVLREEQDRGVSRMHLDVA